MNTLLETSQTKMLDDLITMLNLSEEAPSQLPSGLRARNQKGFISLCSYCDCQCDCGYCPCSVCHYE